MLNVVHFAPTKLDVVADAHVAPSFELRFLDRETMAPIPMGAASITAEVEGRAGISVVQGAYNHILVITGPKLERGRWPWSLTQHGTPIIAGDWLVDDVELVDMPNEYTLLVGTNTHLEFASLVGPQGPPGSRAGVTRWYGEGEPTVVLGAQPGDEYLDTLTGDLYVLQ